MSAAKSRRGLGRAPTTTLATYLVEHAHARDCIIVTREVQEPSTTRRIKIPNAGSGVGVSWVNTYTMLRDEGAQFR